MSLPDIPPGTAPVQARPTRAVWQSAGAAAASRSMLWGALTAVAASAIVGMPWTASAASPVAAVVAMPWGTALAARDDVPAVWGTAGAAGKALSAPWDRAGAASRGWQLPWERARVAVAAPQLPWHLARALPAPRTAPWDAALLLVAPNRPLPPGTVNPPEPPGPVNLLFCQPIELSSLDLVFGQDPCAGSDYEPDGTAIGARSLYMGVHTITAVRLPDLAPLPIESFTLSTDDASFGWSLSFNGPPALRSLLETTSGPPWTMRLTVDGLQFEFVVESVARRRAFGTDDVAVTARSLTALLGDPYMPVAAFLNTTVATAQQLVLQALDYTGAALDWQVDDWLVPAGAWSFSGTPLAAALQVAQTIGAVVTSSRTDAQLVVMPRYPVLPWDWATTVPDTTIALAASLSESYERADSPAYEGVYVSGQSQGELALVKRTGTAPALIMPMVTDPLLTDLVACRQRGEALLGAAGVKVRMTETLPVLTGVGEPGIFNVNKLVQVDDPAGAWKGIVRGVSVRYSRPVLEQTITIERHL